MAARAACDPSKTLDRAIEEVLHHSARVPSLPKVAEALGPMRRAAVQRIVRRVQPEIAPLERQVAAHAPEALRLFDATVAAAVADLRREQQDSWLVQLDRATYHDGTELSDSPAMPMHKRLEIISTLDRFNVHSGSYTRWGDALQPWVDQQRTRGKPPLHIVDLAAGCGGFARALKQRMGPEVRLTATDVVDAFLREGAQRAARERIDVTFAPQNALDLRNLRGTDVDIITCTQSLHHFTPGAVARLIGEAATTANVGICFVDGERGVLATTLITLAMALYGRDWPVVHDTFVSMRRMYVAEELALLAQLAPGLGTEHAISTGRMRPGHAFVKVTRQGYANGRLP